MHMPGRYCEIDKLLQKMFYIKVYKYLFFFLLGGKNGRNYIMQKGQSPYSYFFHVPVSFFFNANGERAYVGATQTKLKTATCVFFQSPATYLCDCSKFFPLKIYELSSTDAPFQTTNYILDGVGRVNLETRKMDTTPCERVVSCVVNLLLIPNSVNFSVTEQMLRPSTPQCPARKKNAIWTQTLSPKLWA